MFFLMFSCFVIFFSSNVLDYTLHVFYLMQPTVVSLLSEGICELEVSNYQRCYTRTGVLSLGGREA